MSSLTFWDNKEKAQSTVQELSACKHVVEPFRKLEEQADDFSVLCEFAREEGADSDMLAEAEATWPDLEKALDALELISFLGGEFDGNGCYMTLAAGAGGTESQDWADMMFRMYKRYLERKGYKAEVMSVQEGDVAGIKSATIHVVGPMAYGYLKAERGVHRLVRISPFDSGKRRHTSFAAVDVTPEIDDDIEIEIEEKDLDITTCRASGAGGQHVNTTDSAVQITHMPTGVRVNCSSERSQHQNRHYAMKALKAKLFELQREEQRKTLADEAGDKTDNAWGSQIRNYVLHPYHMVKDVRTGVETSNTQAVLDGDLDAFVEAFIRSGKGTE
jgi:peptide chain release factor 2